MSWRHRVRAGSKHARESAREVAGRARSRADDLLEATGRADTVRARSEAAVGRSFAATTRVRDLVDTGLQVAGRTRAGGRIGDTTRLAATGLRGLPVLSAVADTVMHKNGVPHLRQQLEDDPTDPMRHIQLAAALARAERDLRAYVAARAAINVSSLVVRQTVKIAAGLDVEGDEPPTRRLLRRAYALCRQRLAVDSKDAAALHALARVYLLEDQPHHAVRFAKLAVAADPDNVGVALVTLARAYLALGHLRPARRAAQMAIAHGMSLGSEVLAEVDWRTALAVGARERMDAYATTRSQATTEDQRTYDGVAYRTTEVLRAVTNVQYDKTRTTGRSIARTVRRTRDRMTRTTTPET